VCSILKDVKSVLEIILKKDKSILLLFHVYIVVFPVPELWRLTAYGFTHISLGGKFGLGNRRQIR